MRAALVVLFGVCSAAALASVKIAAPRLQPAGADPTITAFFSDHLAQQLAHRGLTVTTAAEIATLLGIERQRQLLGCEECQTELGNALGVKGILQGTLSWGGGGYALRARILDVENGQVLAEGTRTAPNEEQLLSAVNELARELATAVLGRPALLSGSQATFEDRLNVLTVGPFHLMLGWYGFEYERVLSDIVSVFAQPQYVSSFLGSSGFELTLGARVYLFGDAPRGFHLGLYGVGGYGRLPGYIPNLAAGVGLELGYQWLLADRVAIVLGLGRGWAPLRGHLAGSSGDIYRFRLSGGVAF